jgi:hypothetical protein
VGEEIKSEWGRRRLGNGESDAWKLSSDEREGERGKKGKGRSWLVLCVPHFKWQHITYMIYFSSNLQIATCLPTCSVLPNSSFLSRDEVKMDGKND